MDELLAGDAQQSVVARRQREPVWCRIGRRSGVEHQPLVGRVIEPDRPIGIADAEQARIARRSQANHFRAAAPCASGRTGKRVGHHQSDRFVGPFFCGVDAEPRLHAAERIAGQKGPFSEQEPQCGQPLVRLREPDRALRRAWGGRRRGCRSPTASHPARPRRRDLPGRKGADSRASPFPAGGFQGNSVPVVSTIVSPVSRFSRRCVSCNSSRPSADNTQNISPLGRAE